MSGITNLRVTGQSSETTTESLISWLERKASPRNGPPCKISRYHPQRDGSIAIEVTVPQRFLHLNGFTFAGSVLQITEESLQSNSRQRNENVPFQRPQGVKPDQRNTGLFDRVSRPQQQSPRSNISIQPRSASLPQSRTAPQANKQFSSQAPQIPKASARWEDPGGIAEKFIRAFYPLYDHNRELAIKQFYDDQSQFSQSITMRGANKSDRSLDWSEYLKSSRNLTRVHKPHVRAARLFTGQQAIYNEWTTLPKTVHPTFEGPHLKEWLLECRPATKLPDPTGISPVGVNGLLITTHAAFEDLGKDGKVSVRSFDRNFILGPTAEAGGVRVISDTVVLRPYSGNFASISTLPPPTAAAPASTIVPSTASASNGLGPNAPTNTIIHPEVPKESGVGEPRPGKTEEQLIREQKVLALSFETRLKLQWADQALTGNNWDMDATKTNIQTLMSTNQIPPEAFLNVDATGGMSV